MVPVSFGLDLNGEKPVVYFHCARKGMKVDLLAYDKRVCVEGDIFLDYELSRSFPCCYVFVRGVSSLGSITRFRELSTLLPRNALGLARRTKATVICL